MIQIGADVSDALAGLDGLLQAVEQATRPAAQAGAEVLYREVLRRVPVSEGPHLIGNRVIQPGALRGAIYQVFSRDNSRPVGDGYQSATYHVSYNASKAPHGHLVEYGHVQTRVVFLGADGRWHTSTARLSAPRHVAARPFLRPAFDAAQAQALQSAMSEFERRVQPALAGQAGRGSAVEASA